MFVPMIGSAASTTTETATQATITAEDSTQQADQETTKPPPTEKQKPEVQVPMSTIVGMRKSNKTAMGVIVSAGLQIDVQDGSVSCARLWGDVDHAVVLTSLTLHSLDVEHRLLVRGESGCGVQPLACFVKRYF
jgi:hypothetical protein